MTPGLFVSAVASRGRSVRTLIPGGEMQWRIWGEGPCVVLLHGGYGSWTHWIRSVLPLSKRFTVLVPDLPGYGASDDIPADIGAERLAEIVMAGLDSLIAPTGSLAFAGFSFGGVMAGQMAALSPGRVRRLVLVGASGLGLPRPPPLKLVKWQGLTDEAERSLAHRANLQGAMIADPARIDDMAIHLQAENTMRARFRSRPLSLTDALRRCLDGAALPLAGIWGERDATTLDFVGTRRDLLRQYDPGCPFEVVPGAGHWVQYEASSAVNASLLDWLA